MKKLFMKEKEFDNFIITRIYNCIVPSLCHDLLCSSILPFFKNESRSILKLLATCYLIIEPEFLFPKEYTLPIYSTW